MERERIKRLATGREGTSCYVDKLTVWDSSQTGELRFWKGRTFPQTQPVTLCQNETTTIKTLGWLKILANFNESYTGFTRLDA